MFSFISLFFSHSFKLLSDLAEFHVKSSIKLFDISTANKITLDNIKYMRTLHQDLKLKGPVIINSFMKDFPMNTSQISLNFSKHKFEEMWFKYLPMTTLKIPQFKT